MGYSKTFVVCYCVNMPMINSIYSTLLKNGWIGDPITVEFAEAYQKGRPKNYAKIEVDLIEQHTGPVKNKRVIDVGAGPGLVSIEMAKRGAIVTWYDISRSYKLLAARNATREKVQVEFIEGLIDEHPDPQLAKYDLVVNLVSWYYSASDKKMANFLKSLTLPHGQIYVSCNVNRKSKKIWNRLTTLLYHRHSLKIGHPFPKQKAIVHALEASGLTTCKYVAPSNVQSDCHGEKNDIERTVSFLGPG